MKIKFGIIRFWIIAFSVLIWNTLKNNNWHMIYVDFETGTKENGWPKRKRLTAMKTTHSLNLYWDITDFMQEENHESKQCRNSGTEGWPGEMSGVWRESADSDQENHQDRLF